METDNQELYFAYGSNLSLRDFCGEFAALADMLDPVGPAWLPDRELAFTRRSQRWQGGVLDVRPQVGAAVRGYLFRVSDNEAWELLDRKEGAPCAYGRVRVPVFQGDGAITWATTYEVRERCDFVRPNTDTGYLGCVRRGYKAWDLPTSQIDAAVRDENLLIDSVFAYGTLMRGESRFDLLQPAKLRCVLLAETYGRLLDLGDYPALVAGRQLVQGEFVRHSDVPRLLRKLDRVEGFSGWEQPDGLFTRTIVTVGMCDGRTRVAWTYRAASPPTDAPVILSADWRRFHARREPFIRRLARRHSHDTEGCDMPFAERPPRARSGLDEDAVGEALLRGDISERQLAKKSGRWTVLP